MLAKAGEWLLAFILVLTATTSTQASAQAMQYASYTARRLYPHSLYTLLASQSKSQTFGIDGEVSDTASIPKTVHLGTTTVVADISKVMVDMSVYQALTNLQSSPTTVPSINPTETSSPALSTVLALFPGYSDPVPSTSLLFSEVVADEDDLTVLTTTQSLDSRYDPENGTEEPNSGSALSSSERLMFVTETGGVQSRADSIYTATVATRRQRPTPTPVAETGQGLRSTLQTGERERTIQPHTYNFPTSNTLRTSSKASRLTSRTTVLETTNSTAAISVSDGIDTTAIVVGVVLAVAALILVLLIAYLYKRKMSRSSTFAPSSGWRSWRVTQFFSEKWARLPAGKQVTTVEHFPLTSKQSHHVDHIRPPPDPATMVKMKKNTDIDIAEQLEIQLPNSLLVLLMNQEEADDRDDLFPNKPGALVSQKNASKHEHQDDQERSRLDKQLRRKQTPQDETDSAVKPKHSDTSERGSVMSSPAVGNVIGNMNANGGSALETERLSSKKVGWITPDSKRKQTTRLPSTAENNTTVTKPTSSQALAKDASLSVQDVNDEHRLAAKTYREEEAAEPQLKEKRKLRLPSKKRRDVVREAGTTLSSDSLERSQSSLPPLTQHRRQLPPLVGEQATPSHDPKPLWKDQRSQVKAKRRQTLLEGEARPLPGAGSLGHSQPAPFLSQHLRRPLPPIKSHPQL